MLLKITEKINAFEPKRSNPGLILTLCYEQLGPDRGLTCLLPGHTGLHERV